MYAWCLKAQCLRKKASLVSRVSRLKVGQSHINTPAIQVYTKGMWVLRIYDSVCSSELPLLDCATPNNASAQDRTCVHEQMRRAHSSCVAQHHCMLSAKAGCNAHNNGSGSPHAHSNTSRAHKALPLMLLTRNRTLPRDWLKARV